MKFAPQEPLQHTYQKKIIPISGVLRRSTTFIVKINMHNDVKHSLVHLSNRLA